MKSFVGKGRAEDFEPYVQADHHLHNMSFVEGSVGDNNKPRTRPKRIQSLNVPSHKWVRPTAKSISSKHVVIGSMTAI